MFAVMKKILIKVYHFLLRRLGRPLVRSRTHVLDAPQLQRQVVVTCILPPQTVHEQEAAWSLAVFSDGQDFDALKMMPCIDQLLADRKISPVLVVGIFAGDRMQEFGVAGIPDYLDRGAKASGYSDFILETLLPFLERHYPLVPRPDHRIIAGFSLGGLSAMDIAWRHPDIFGKAGVFSGSFWWRSAPFDPQNPDADRIMPALIANTRQKPQLKVWLQTGTLDETSDRNNNGIIDAIDDTLDVIAAMEKVGLKQNLDIFYLEVDGGEHNQATWGAVMPDFLQWALPL